MAALPTTELSDAADKAAVWLGTHWWEAPRPLVPFLRRKFKLSAIEAIQALREGSRMQHNGGADVAS
jgi:hypothetical protein